MLGTLQNFIDRFERRPSGPPQYRTPAPVVTALGDRSSEDLGSEISLVIAVTGRRHLEWRPELALPRDVTSVLLVTGTGTVRGRDGAPVSGQEVAADLVSRGVSVRQVTVTGDPSHTSPEPYYLLPAQAPELAAYLGASDVPVCAVYGSVGGAGASTFAAALAGALADPDLGGDGRSLLVDSSGNGDLEFLLGLEDSTGHRMRDIAGTPVLTGPALRELPWAADVAVLTGSGAPPTRLDVGCPVVHDCGRWMCGSPSQAGIQVTRTVLVVPATVPGTLAARAVLEQLPGASVVLREMPRAELEWNDALTLMGRAPETDWRDDPYLVGETDRGEFTPTLTGAGTAGDAASRLVGEVW